MKLFKKKKKAKKKSVRIFKPAASKYFVLTFKSIISFFVFLLLVALVIFIFTSDYFKVNNISCEKDKLPCSEKEKSLFLDLLGANIFLLDTNKKIKAIKSNHPQIKKITIEKKLLNKILIQMINRQEYAALTLDEKFWFIVDRHGFVFQQINYQPKNLPLIYLKNNKFDLKINEQIKHEGAKSALLILESMGDNFISLDKIMVDFDKTITLFLSEGVVASLSARKEILSQVDSLHFILRQSKIEGRLPIWVDLRFDKPVIKF